MCFYDNATAMAYQIGQWKTAGHDHHREAIRQAAIGNVRPPRFAALFRRLWRRRAGEARR